MTTQFDEVLKGSISSTAISSWSAWPNATMTIGPRVRGARGLERSVVSVQDGPARRPTGRPRSRSARPQASRFEHEKDEQIRQKIVGTWSLNDRQGNLTLVSGPTVRLWRPGRGEAV